MEGVDEHKDIICSLALNAGYRGRGKKSVVTPLLDQIETIIFLSGCWLVLRVLQRKRFSYKEQKRERRRRQMPLN